MNLLNRSSLVPLLAFSSLVAWANPIVFAETPQIEGRIKESRNARFSQAEIVLGHEGATSGEVIVHWKLDRPLEKGVLNIETITAQDSLQDFFIQLSADGFQFDQYIPGMEKVNQGAVVIPLPGNLKGRNEIFMRIRALKDEAGGSVVTLQVPKLKATFEDGSAKEIHPWHISEIDPWVEADAASLPTLATSLKQSKQLSISGPVNDWVSSALLISLNEPTRYRVDLEVPEELQGCLEMRVVGQAQGPFGEIVWDAIFAEDQVEKSAVQAFNYPYIKNFPNLVGDRNMPTYLWFTADLRGVRPGEYEAKLVVSTEDGVKRQEVPIKIEVLKDVLPEENPLYVITWNSWKESQMEDMIAHGVNVAYQDHELAWKKGARFLLFQFMPTFKDKEYDPTKEGLILAELDKITALVQRLKVPANQWAVYLYDEVSDSTAETIGKYAELIKRRRPNIPIWQNPLYGGQADAAMAAHTATVNGTIKKIEQTTDIYCPYLWHVGGPLWSYLEKTGKPLWFYEIWGSAGRSPSTGRDAWRTLPYMARRYNAQGIGNYALNTYGNSGIFRGKPNHYSVVYPSHNSRLVSSRSFEALRQGIQEYKLMNLLLEKGVSPELVESWTFIGLRASRAETVSDVRSEMIRLLKTPYQPKPQK